MENLYFSCHIIVFRELIMAANDVVSRVVRAVAAATAALTVTATKKNKNNHRGRVTDVI